MRVNTNFLNRINAITLVQSLVQKYSDLQKTQISRIALLSCPPEGRFAIVTDVGRDAVDARRRADEALHLADGEVVWS
jgi:hypothetical protein